MCVSYFSKITCAQDFAGGKHHIWILRVGVRLGLQGSSLHPTCRTQRVQVPNIEGRCSQKPSRVWYLEPESLNIGFLDPLGNKMAVASKRAGRSASRGFRYRGDSGVRARGRKV